MDELTPLITTEVLVGQSVAMQRRYATAHSDWDPAFEVLPECE